MVKDASQCPPGSVSPIQMFPRNVETLVVVPIYYGIFLSGANPPLRSKTGGGYDLSGDKEGLGLNSKTGSFVPREEGKFAPLSNGIPQKESFAKSSPNIPWNKLLGRSMSSSDSKANNAKIGKSLGAYSKNDQRRSIDLISDHLPSEGIRSTFQPTFKPSQPFVYNLGPFQFNGNIHHKWIPLIAAPYKHNGNQHLHDHTELDSKSKLDTINKFNLSEAENSTVDLPIESNIGESVEDLSQPPEEKETEESSKPLAVIFHSPVNIFHYVTSGTTDEEINPSKKQTSLLSLKNGLNAINLTLGEGFNLHLRRKLNGDLSLTLKRNEEGDE